MTEQVAVIYTAPLLMQFRALFSLTSRIEESSDNEKPTPKAWVYNNGIRFFRGRRGVSVGFELAKQNARLSRRYVPEEDACQRRDATVCYKEPARREITFIMRASEAASSRVLTSRFVQTRLTGR